MNEMTLSEIRLTIKDFIRIYKRHKNKIAVDILKVLLDNMGILHSYDFDGFIRKLRDIIIVLESIKRRYEDDSDTSIEKIDKINEEIRILMIFKYFITNVDGSY